MTATTARERPRPTLILLQRGEAIAGSVAFALWLILYTAGTLVGTGPARDRLSGDAPALEKLRLLPVVLLCYTVTNVAILCSLASILGGLFRRGKRRSRGLAAASSPLVLLFSLALQGFVVYLVIISGVISFSGKHALMDGAGQDQYVRLAATASLVSFLVGYSPAALNGLLARLERMIGEEPAAAPDDEPEPEPSPA